jgi:hypothetical protein
LPCGPERPNSNADSTVAGALHPVKVLFGIFTMLASLGRRSIVVMLTDPGPPGKAARLPVRGGVGCAVGTQRYRLIQPWKGITKCTSPTSFA